ncbi:MAG: Na/Pi cotransporter family protein [Bacteroidales bacterium]|nr:Na/Pi cotransporter family protein [Bacteroidales bacterium]
MGANAVISAILMLLAGIGIFLIACQIMSSNLESLSSARLKDLFSKASKSKLLGVGIGTLGTAAIQSSGATTVMVIGFVNAGIISLAQAATMIYGANIGTTVTAQIVALGMFGGNSISTSVIFSAFAGVGAFMAVFAKKDGLKKVGGILTGFGMLFVGLTIMSDSMGDFAKLDSVNLFLAKIDNAVLLVIIGAIFTAIIQSSSVMTSIAIAMVVTGLISLNQGIFLTMGSNIGSCVVALIAGLTSGKNAKRTSLIHLIFNCSGVVIFLIAGWLMELFGGDSLSFGTLFEKMFPGAPQTQLAMFHTVFNVITVIIVLPLTALLVKTVCAMVPDREAETEDPTKKLFYIDDNMLSTPPVALSQTKAEITNMASIAIDNYNRSLDIITTMDYSQIEKFRNDEEELDFLNIAITEYAVKLSKRHQLGEKDRNYLAGSYRTIHDLERIGDYAENIIEYADNLKGTSETFSDPALQEISELRKMINDLFAFTMKAYNNEDLKALAEANRIEDMIDDFTEKMEDNHLDRLADGVCSLNVGAQYLSLASNSERVADHLINVAKTITHLK